MLSSLGSYAVHRLPPTARHTPVTACFQGSRSSPEPVPYYLNTSPETCLTAKLQPQYRIKADNLGTSTVPQRSKTAGSRSPVVQPQQAEAVQGPGSSLSDQLHQAGSMLHLNSMVSRYRSELGPEQLCAALGRAAVLLHQTRSSQAVGQQQAPLSQASSLQQAVYNGHVGRFMPAAHATAAAVGERSHSHAAASTSGRYNQTHTSLRGPDEAPRSQRQRGSSTSDSSTGLHSTDGFQGQNDAITVALLTRLAGNILSNHRRMGIEHMAYVLVALTRLGYKRIDLLNAIAGHSYQYLHTASAQELEAFCWSFSQLGFQPSRPWLNTFTHVVHLHIRQGSYNRIQLPSVALSCSKFGKRLSAEWMESLCSAAFEQLPRYRPRQFASLAQVLASMKHLPEDAWMNRYLTHSEKVLPHFNAAQLVVTASSLASLGCRPSDAWLDAYYSRMQVLAPSLDACRFSIVVCSLAKLNCKPTSEWLNGCLMATRKTLGQLPLENLTDLIQALARVRFRPSDPWVVQFFAATFQRLPFLTPAQSCSIVQSLARLGHTPQPAWLSEYGRQVRLRLPQCSGQMQVEVLCALVQLGFRPDTQFLSDFESASNAKLATCSAESLAVLVQSLAAVGFQPQVSWLYSYILALYSKLDAFDAGQLAAVFEHLPHIAPSPTWLDEIVQICAAEVSVMRAAAAQVQPAGQQTEALASEAINEGPVPVHSAPAHGNGAVAVAGGASYEGKRTLDEEVDSILAEATLMLTSSLLSQKQAQPQPKAPPAVVAAAGALAAATSQASASNSTAQLAGPARPATAQPAHSAARSRVLGPSEANQPASSTQQQQLQQQVAALAAALPAFLAADADAIDPDALLIPLTAKAAGPQGGLDGPAQTVAGGAKAEKAVLQPKPYAKARQAKELQQQMLSALVQEPAEFTALVIGSASNNGSQQAELVGTKQPAEVMAAVSSEGANASSAAGANASTNGNGYTAANANATGNGKGRSINGTAGGCSQAQHEGSQCTEQSAEEELALARAAQQGMASFNGSGKGQGNGSGQLTGSITPTGTKMRQQPVSASVGSSRRSNTSGISMYQLGTIWPHELSSGQPMPLPSAS